MFKVLQWSNHRMFWSIEEAQWTGSTSSHLFFPFLNFKEMLGERGPLQATVFLDYYKQDTKNQVFLFSQFQFLTPGLFFQAMMPKRPAEKLRICSFIIIYRAQLRPKSAREASYVWKISWIYNLKWTFLCMSYPFNFCILYLCSKHLKNFSSYIPVK